MEESVQDVMAMKLMDKILRAELQRCISELQSLQSDFALVAEGDIRLAHPDKYTYYQQIFISKVVNNINQALTQMGGGDSIDT